MTPQTILHVPKSAWPDITSLIAFPLDELKNLVDCISNSEAVPDVEDLVERCSQTSNAHPEDIESVLAVAINLSYMRRKLNVTENVLISQFVSTLERSQFEGWDDEIEAKLEERQALLARLMAPDGPIDIMSKARELLFEAQCVSVGSAVISDIRPVYDTSATKLCGGLVLHTLSLDYLEGRE